MSEVPLPQSEIILYETEDGRTRIQCRFQNETVWLTQKALAELFGVDRSVVTKHLRNVFQEDELAEDSVCANFAHTAADGKTYSTKYYNLDAIIAVGYRVNSYQATQFRIWATKTLREFIIKGFVLDDERLKQGKQVQVALCIGHALRGAISFESHARLRALSAAGGIRPVL